MCVCSVLVNFCFIMSSTQSQLHHLLWRLRCTLFCFVWFGCFFLLFFVFVFISFSTFGYACLTFDGWLMSKLQVCIWTFSSNSFEHSPSRSHTRLLLLLLSLPLLQYTYWRWDFFYFAFLFHHRKNTTQAVSEEEDNVRQSRHRKKFSSNRYRTHSYITLSVIRCSLLSSLLLHHGVRSHSVHRNWCAKILRQQKNRSTRAKRNKSLAWRIKEKRRWQNVCVRARDRDECARTRAYSTKKK